MGEVEREPLPRRRRACDELADLFVRRKSLVRGEPVPGRPARGSVWGRERVSRIRGGALLLLGLLALLLRQPRLERRDLGRAACPLHAAHDMRERAPAEEERQPERAREGECRERARARRHRPRQGHALPRVVDPHLEEGVEVHCIGEVATVGELLERLLRGLERGVRALGLALALDGKGPGRAVLERQDERRTRACRTLSSTHRRLADATEGDEAERSVTVRFDDVQREQVRTRRDGRSVVRERPRPPVREQGQQEGATHVRERERSPLGSGPPVSKERVETGEDADHCGEDEALTRGSRTENRGELSPPREGVDEACLRGRREPSEGHEPLFPGVRPRGDAEDRPARTERAIHPPPA